ncbi:uncharacterized protein EDB91DRAFT_1090084 [Suillus paluster]|uniref:uncharacterized protein n=1 Tax=Suillus paluster TaxID=48578 RepID=UPI001B879EC0|nr:uncharacterized protein EDB91DRAFT_1090084 [Suillus paluster]KAG1718382.1 hypothetical protein EDB91DRAFT_1090084 [Suillus paluster]
MAIYFFWIRAFVNWVTLGHHDAGGASSHYDLLASLGIGHNANFRIEDLEAELDYFPGTLIIDLGNMSGGRYRVISWSDQDSNWKKLVGLETVKTLLKKHKRAIKGISDTKPPFDELTHSLDDEKNCHMGNDEKKAMEE